MKIISLGLSALVVSCGTNGASSRLLVEQNDLGVTAIETDRSDSAFELRGFDANGHELASLSLRTGSVMDLPGTGDDHGSEILVSVGDAVQRFVTRETARFELGPFAPDMQRLFDISTVSTVLEDDANIIVSGAPGTEEVPFTAGVACPASTVQTSPVAGICCYDTAQTLFGLGGFGSTTLVQRSRNPHGTACKASDGVGSCSGAACFYGPAGFARPVKSTAPMGQGQFVFVYTYQGSACLNFWSTTMIAGTAQFPDTTGTIATGQGCPGGTSGAYQWDY